jgi:uracil-DNA glycosylase
VANIALVGEAWGIEEAKARAPFVGGSGYELTKMLKEAGIHRADCHLTNVFNLHPPSNDLSFLCGPKERGVPGYPKLLRGNDKSFNHYTGDYVRAKFLLELERLSDELIEVDPNVVVALGNTALWALAGQTTISKSRGSTMLSTHTASGFKVLPTYHPAAVLRQWNLRPICVVDLGKALRESTHPEIIRPTREIWIEPTLEDIYEFHRRFIEGVPLISVDIETSGRSITCLGIAPARQRAIVIPFYSRKGLGRNYWGTAKLEREVWSYVSELLGSPSPRKLFQNGLYDIAFLYRAMGIVTRGAAEDTMLLHYSLQPESLKGLGFLGSVYTDEGSWKDLRKFKGTKRDD